MCYHFLIHCNFFICSRPLFIPFKYLGITLSEIFLKRRNKINHRSGLKRNRPDPGIIVHTQNSSALGDGGMTASLSPDYSTHLLRGDPVSNKTEGLQIQLRAKGPASKKDIQMADLVSCTVSHFKIFFEVPSLRLLFQKSYC